MEIQQIGFALSCVDSYIRENCKYDMVRDLPLETAKALYDMLPAEEQQKVPKHIIIDESRLNKFLRPNKKS